MFITEKQNFNTNC